MTNIIVIKLKKKKLENDEIFADKILSIPIFNQQIKLN